MAEIIIDVSEDVDALSEEPIVRIDEANLDDFAVVIGTLRVVMTMDQMERLYKAVREWFEPDTASAAKED